MRNRYQCDVCGCYLDPGEGLLCDECTQKVRSKALRGRKIQEIIQENDMGQMEMNIQEAGAWLKRQWN